jgi:putative ABC transport system ATP-binding protein
LTVALRDVSLALAPGQFSLVMGPSGSGKSTLLAALAGLLRPDGGQVLALGQDLWKLTNPDRRQFRLRHSGFIFQGYNLFPTLTVAEQLEMVLRWGGGVSRREARERVAAMLGLLGLSRKAHLLPGQLSGGEKQRVAVGRAMIKKPAFCFADEPTSALDWAQGRQVVEMLHGAAHRGGATVLIVAHDTRIAPYADRLFHLEDGCLIERATPSEGAPWNASGTPKP